MTSRLINSRREAAVFYVLAALLCWTIPFAIAFLVAKDLWEAPIYTPRRLPKRRRRRLTGPSCQKPMGIFPKPRPGRTREQSDPQQSTPTPPSSSLSFLHLSPELRTLIYRELLSDHVIHIGLARGESRQQPARMMHLRSKNPCPHPHIPGYYDCNMNDFGRYSAHRGGKKIPLDQQSSGQLLALTKTCRQMCVYII